MDKEDKYLENLNSDQLYYIKTLKKMGFLWKYATVYAKEGFKDIDVTLMEKLKIWE